MAQQQSHEERLEQSLLSNKMSAEFAALGKKRVEDFVNAQTDLLEELRDMNREWLERLRSEATLASEFTSRLMAAHSVPEVMTVCQEWTTRRLQMMVEDGQHVLADIQKFTETSARLAADGWVSKGTGK